MVNCRAQIWGIGWTIGGHSFGYWSIAFSNWLLRKCCLLSVNWLFRSSLYILSFIICIMHPPLSSSLNYIFSVLFKKIVGNWLNRPLLMSHIVLIVMFWWWGVRMISWSTINYLVMISENYMTDQMKFHELI
jgi:hypothetical protein